MMEGHDGRNLFARFERAFGRRQRANSISGRPPRAAAEALLLVLTFGTAAALYAQSGENPAAQSPDRATSGTYSLLYSFQNSPSDGCAPAAGLILDSSGNLYGTTIVGGPIDDGTVFKVTPSGTETVLHSFTTTSRFDGNSPEMGSLTLDAEGNLYGTTQYGGKFNAGTVYEVLATGGERVLYSFTGRADGGQPLGGMVHDSDGNLYGTTFSGGSGGVVFKLTPDGTESVLHNFDPASGDGANPEGDLTRDPAGNLYGTTRYGGASDACEYGCGTVFKVAPDGTETLPYSFKGDPSDGAAPTGGGLLRGDTSGDLYSVTYEGGAANRGALFKLTSSGTETELLNFNTGNRGGYPVDGLTRDEAGNLYGTTTSFGTGAGCATGCGVLFELTAAGSYIVLHNFTFGSPSDGDEPWGGVVRDQSGNLYGTLQGGGAHNCGAVFKYTP